jgi:hypothetical protein
MKRLCLLVFLCLQWSIPPSDALARLVRLRNDDDNDNDNERESSSIRPGISNSPLKFKIDPSTLSSRALEISGDSAFARQLQAEAEKQTTTDQPIPSSTLLVLEHHPLVYGGILAVIGASLVSKGSWAMLRETLISVASTLAIAWIPAWILRAGWVEVLSIGTLFLRPTMRYFIQTEVWPIMSSTIRKVVFAEAWRRLWLLLLSPLPKPLLVPRSKDYYRLLPKWMQRGMETLNKYVDKFSQRLILKVAEGSVHEMFGGVFSSVTDSILEMSFVYEESSSDTEVETTETEVETTETKVSLEDDDNDLCEGGVCQL